MIVSTFVAFTSCKPEEEPEPDPIRNSLYWKIDGTTCDATPILADCGIANPYSINVFDNHIYITTDGGYSSNGDVFCFNMSGTRQWKAEAGMLPSKVEPYENAGTGNMAYVLNEGMWGNNDATLSKVNRAQGNISNKVFSNANHRSLGDVAQDIVAYGSKAYVAVTFSNSVEVINTDNDLSTRIDVSSSAKNPRRIAAHGGKIYVTCYDPCSVVRIDTATLTVEAVCRLGGYHPEGIAVAGGKLVVASSHISDEHSNYTYDDKVYIVDIASFEVQSTITVGTNPVVVKALNANKVVVGYIGDYGQKPAGTAIVNVTDGSVRQLDKALYNFDVYEGSIYGYESIY